MSATVRDALCMQCSSVASVLKCNHSPCLYLQVQTHSMSLHSLSALHSTQEAGGWDSGNNITAVSYETFYRAMQSAVMRLHVVSPSVRNV